MLFGETRCNRALDQLMTSSTFGNNSDPELASASAQASVNGNTAGAQQILWETAKVTRLLSDNNSRILTDA